MHLHGGVVLAGRLHGRQGVAADDRHLVAGELVLAEQFAHFHLDQFEQLGVIDGVDLVQGDDDARHADLAGEQDVLARLRHGAVVGGDDEDGAVHLGGAGDHVLDVVGVAGAVDVGVVAVGRLVLDVGHGDGDGLEIVALGAALGDVLVHSAAGSSTFLPLKVVILFLNAERITRAAVSVVLPWSMWPMVPTLTCGLVREKTSLAIVPPLGFKARAPEAVREPGDNVRQTKELLLGVEPKTSTLPMWCSTIELQQPKSLLYLPFSFAARKSGFGGSSRKPHRIWRSRPRVFALRSADVHSIPTR